MCLKIEEKKGEQSLVGQDKFFLSLTCFYQER